MLPLWIAIHCAGDANDLAYVLVTITDANGGTRVPDQDIDVHFGIKRTGGGPGGTGDEGDSGSARPLVDIVAVGSGDPRDTSSFQAAVRKTWRGRCVAIVRPAAGATGGGQVAITASTTLGGWHRR